MMMRAAFARPLVRRSTAAARVVGRGALARSSTSSSTHARLRRAVGPENVTYFVHVANLCACCALVSDDMLALRTFMIGSSASMIAFNMLQPKSLVAPAAWASFFICGHAFQILRILNEGRAVGMTDREHALYERGFMRYGFSPRLFKELLASAAWLDYGAGEELVAEGSAVRHVFVVVAGAVDLRKRGEKVRMIDVDSCPRGAWIGRCYESAGDENEIHAFTATAASPLRVVRFDRAALRSTIDASPAATAAAEKLEIDGLAGKLESTVRGHLAIEHEYARQVADLQDKLRQRRATAEARKVTEAG